MLEAPRITHSALEIIKSYCTEEVSYCVCIEGPHTSVRSEKLSTHVLRLSQPLHVLHVVLKARHLSDSAFCYIDIGFPEQAVGGFTLGSGLVVEDRPSELSCTCIFRNECKSILYP